MKPTEIKITKVTNLIGETDYLVSWEQDGHQCEPFRSAFDARDRAHELMTEAGSVPTQATLF